MCMKGVICGIRVEDIEEPLMQEIRYLDVDDIHARKQLEVMALNFKDT